MIYILRDLLSGRQIYPQKLWKLYVYTHTIQGKLTCPYFLNKLCMLAWYRHSPVLQIIQFRRDSNCVICLGIKKNKENLRLWMRNDWRASLLYCNPSA